MAEKRSPLDSFHRSSDLLRTYKRAVLWRKGMLAAFAIIFGALLLWAIPWLPYGLSVQDYDQRLTLLVGLVIMASVTAFGTVYHRDLSRRVEQTLLTWSTVHQGLGDMRQREYFYDRLVIECERSRNSGRQFSILVLRIEEIGGESLPDGAIERALASLAPIVLDYDCLAALGAREIGVLAPVMADNTPAFAERLCGLVSDASGAGEYAPRVRAGWAVYNVDAEEAGALVGLARERVLGKTPNNLQPEETAVPDFDVKTA